VQSRINPLIVHFIWGLGGLTLGAASSLLVIKNWTPDWIEATGTWFGAVATVLTLLWAVRSFRSDQAQREISRQEEVQKDLAIREERERGSLEEAENVAIALQGGAAYGGPPDQMMTSVHVTIRNHARYDVIVKRIVLNIPIPASDTASYLIEIAEVPARAGDLGGQPMSRFAAEMFYRLDGRDWSRTSDSGPKRLTDQDDEF
jgi:hypothetical protein